jgi:hypothetical protein
LWWLLIVKATCETYNGDKLECHRNERKKKNETLKENKKKISLNWEKKLDNNVLDDELDTVVGC